MTSTEQKVQNYAEDYVAGVATALIGKLGQLLVEEYQLLSSIRGEVVLLRDDTAMMNALFRMLSETDDGVVTHFLLEWMKQVRELSYDAEDCIDLFVHHISWAPILLDRNCLGRAWHQMVRLYRRHCLGNDIKALRARATAISERRAHYGISRQELPPSLAFGSRTRTWSTPPLPGAANHDPTQLVVGKKATALSSEVDCGVVIGGTTEEQDQISPQITKKKEPDPKLKVYSILGPGGVGKSTLAVEVFRQLKVTFQCHAFVPVSQDFDANEDLDELTRDIYKQFGHTDVGTAIQDYLNDKRYLVVLDNVWAISTFNAIRERLRDNNMGSRIIVTTRIGIVASTCSSGVHYIHQANILSGQESQSLFITRVFGQVPQEATSSDPRGVCPEELQEEMNIILKKCGGLPLAIVTIASVLARYNSPKSIEMWRRVCNSTNSQLESNSAIEEMVQIIALSYNHLSHNLKACTMLLSIFPGSYEIPKARLLRRWISEGLIPEQRGFTLYEVAESCYNELLSRNVIQRVVNIDGAVSYDHCRVHDIMLDVIVSKSIEANFVSLVGSPRGRSSYGAVRRLAIHDAVGYYNGEGTEMHQVRSLTSFGANITNGPGRQLLDQLAEFTLLRVLDLEDYKHLNDHHLKQVCKLFLLRYLNLNGTNIERIPGQISNLQHLQTLTLFDTQLDEFPESVVKLENLEHMTFSKLNDDGSIFLRLPEGINKMKSLQLLHGLAVGEHDINLAEEIGHLVHLRSLKAVVLSELVRGQLENSIANIKLSSPLRDEITWCT